MNDPVAIGVVICAAMFAAQVCAACLLLTWRLLRRVVRMVSWLLTPPPPVRLPPVTHHCVVPAYVAQPGNRYMVNFGQGAALEITFSP